MSGELRVHLSEDDADSARLAELTGYLRSELRQLDVDDVSALPGHEPPPGSRAFGAAFSRAAARCSGVSGGRATRGHLGFRIEKVAPRGETSEFSPARQREPPFAPAQIIQFDAPYIYRYSA